MVRTVLENSTIIVLRSQIVPGAEKRWVWLVVIVMPSLPDGVGAINRFTATVARPRMHLLINGLVGRRLSRGRGAKVSIAKCRSARAESQVLQFSDDGTEVERNHCCRVGICPTNKLRVICELLLCCSIRWEASHRDFVTYGPPSKISSYVSGYRL